MPPRKVACLVFQFVLLALLIPPTDAHGQDLTGIWQGNLHPPDQTSDLRTLIKVTASENSTFKGSFYILEGRAVPFAASVTVQNGTVRINISEVQFVFEGKLSLDGKTISGNLKQGFPVALPWTLHRVPENQAWAIPKMPASPKPMTNANPVFEVASIKLTNPETWGRTFRVEGPMLTVKNMAASDLVTMAYEIDMKQIASAPAWFESEKFDITAKAEGDGQPNDEQLNTMLRKLLADRFQFSAHREMREMAVYTLMPAKGGLKMSKGDAGAGGALYLDRGPGSWGASHATMRDLAKLLQLHVVDRPVVDQTGTSDRYDFSFSWTPAQPDAPLKDDLSPDIFTALRQQLGLNLAPAKMDVDVLVIDRIQKPSPN